MLKLIRIKKGAAVIEAALCLPVILYLLFFILEAVRIAIYQITLDNIALEATFEYSAFKNTSKFADLIKKNTPSFLGTGVEIRCYINAYSTLEELTSSSTFGGEVSWPSQKVTVTIPESEAVKAGTAFELTVVCDYKFTNTFVSKLFAGGTNSSDGEHFYLWSRATCVCN